MRNFAVALVTISVLFTGIAGAHGVSDSAVQPPKPPTAPPPFNNPDCAKLATISYQPPQDLILKTARALDAADHNPFSATPSKQDESHMSLVIRVGAEGLVNYVSLSQSSGKRLLDRAGRNWAYGLMFSPLDCGNATQYQIVLPVNVVLTAGGA